MAKKYEELTFTDDFMFCKILENNPDLCRELLSLILDRPVGPLAPITSQKPIEITADGKGVRFDVYAKDDDKIIYNIEMQNVANDNIAKRARYSQGMIDLNLIERGAKYEELNRSYIIYICKFNLYKEVGLHKYSFSNLCVEDPTIRLGDEAEKIFLCTQGTADDVSEKMKAFLVYVASNRPSNEFTAQLENAVQKARDHIQWRKEYMTFLEQLEKEYREGYDKGHKEGVEQERANTERERLRAESSEKRADSAEKRADSAEAELERYKKLLASHGIADTE